MNGRYIAAGLGWLIWMLASCATGKKTVSSATGRTNELCSSIPFSAAEPAVKWQPAERPKKADVKEIPLPSRFESYTIDPAQLKAYFSYAGSQKEKTGFSVPLPGNLGCQYFELTDAGILSPELAKKYPDIISLKGVAANNRGAAIRLDHDGSRMSAEVIWGSSIYFVKPVLINGNIIYLVYDRADTNEIKEPVDERIKDASRSDKPAQIKQPTYDR